MIVNCLPPRIGRGGSDSADDLDKAEGVVK